jgi:hypothetical protein
MRHVAQRMLPVWISLGLLIAATVPVGAADPEIDNLLQSPVGKDWVTNGGNLTNHRYSTLKQIDTTNVKQLKGAWMTRLKGSGFGGKYSAEATPLVKDGIMYMVTGNDDVFALNAKTGEILWERWSGIDQQISMVCCGWLNRGLAMGEGVAVPRPARCQCGRSRHQDRQGGVENPHRRLEEWLRDHQCTPLLRRDSLHRQHRRGVRCAEPSNGS